MVSWKDFEAQAPAIAEVFSRRHKATGHLCLLATLRADGAPRISPMEPQIVDGQLILVGMPNTRKFRDLGRDPRFELHTATVDPFVGEGDAKLWGEALNVRDEDLHRRFADHLFAESGFDLRKERFDPFYVADLRGASAIGFAKRKLTITTWKPGEGERTEALD
jgi:hypothetical protein